MNDIVEKKVSGLTIKIEKMTCIASENCINVSPDLFGLDDERICSFNEKAEGIAQEIIIEACSVCPVNALYVYDEEGKQIVP
jgi:ferredoxin